MQAFVITLFVIVCLLQIVSVLLQASKGGGMAGAFGGGGGMGAMFGSRGAATFLSKLTAGLATAFMIIALLLGMMTSRGGGGESQGLVEQERQSRGTSPAAILPSAPATQSTQPLPQPVTQPTKGDSGK